MGCQQKPTLVTTESQTVLAKDVGVKKILTAETVIIDARPAFEFGLNHVNGSLNLNPSELKSPGAEIEGHLDFDLFRSARILSRKGLDPETPVVIIGSGLKGQGEEGLMAWYLNQLGFRKVQTMSMDLLRAQIQPEMERPSKPLWKPTSQETLMDYDEFWSLLKAHGIKNQLQRPPIRQGLRVGRKIEGGRLWILDVSDKASTNLNQWIEIEAIQHISWKKFYDEKGFVSSRVLQDLRSATMSDKDQILVLSDNGISSGAATYALNELGFKNAKNYPLGLNSLQRHQKVHKNRAH